MTQTIKCKRMIYFFFKCENRVLTPALVLAVIGAWSIIHQQHLFMGAKTPPFIWQSLISDNVFLTNKKVPIFIVIRRHQTQSIDV